MKLFVLAMMIAVAAAQGGGGGGGPSGHHHIPPAPVGALAETGLPCSQTGRALVRSDISHNSGNMNVCGNYQYGSNTCCSNTTTFALSSLLGFQQLYNLGNILPTCTPLSQGCLQQLQALSCFLECSPYAAISTSQAPTAQPYGINMLPICGSFANAIYDACSADFTCSPNWVLSSQCTGPCKTFSAWFPDAATMVQSIWNNTVFVNTSEPIGEKLTCFTPEMTTNGDSNSAVYYEKLSYSFKPHQHRKSPSSHYELPESLHMNLDFPNMYTIPQPAHITSSTYCNHRVFVGNRGVFNQTNGQTIPNPANVYTLSVFDANNIGAGPIPGGVIDTGAMFKGAVAGLACHENVLAITITPFPQSGQVHMEEFLQNGTLYFIDALTLLPLNANQPFTVGVYPENLAFAPNGSALIVANKGPTVYNYTNGNITGILGDAPGTVNIIPLGAQNNFAMSSQNVSTAVAALTQSMIFATGYTNRTILNHNVRFGIDNNNPAIDIEPGHITINAASSLAYIACTTNNAYLVMEVTTGYWRELISFGLKDHSQDKMGLDAAYDGRIDILRWPVLGMNQPRMIELIYTNGQPYILTVNTGEPKASEVTTVAKRVASVNAQQILISSGSVHAGHVANIPDLEVSNLNRTNINGNLVNSVNPSIVGLYSFGGRSFSSFYVDGTLAYDSGEELERAIAWANPTQFNSHNGTNPDIASTHRGCAPASLNTVRMLNKLYAFIGFQDCNGLVAYDVSLATGPVFVEYIPLPDSGRIQRVLTRHFVDPFNSTMVNTTAEQPLYVIFEDGTLFPIHLHATLDKTRSAVSIDPAWTLRQPLPLARSDVQAVVIGTAIYVAGGCIVMNQNPQMGCQNVSGAVDVFDTDSQTWNNNFFFSFMAQPRGHYAASDYNGRLVVIGGRPADSTNGIAFSSCELYDPASGIWHPFATYPLNVADLAAVTIDGTIYAFGGWSSNYDWTYSNTYYYNATTLGWTIISSAALNNGSGRAEHSAVVSNGRIYVAGGYTRVNGQQFVLNSLEMFSPGRGMWEYRASVPSGGVAAAALVNLAGSLLFYGGEVNNNTVNAHRGVSNNVFAYNVNSDTWTPQTAMPTYRARFAGASVGSVAYAIGGRNFNHNLLDVSEGFQFERVYSPEHFADHQNIVTQAAHQYFAELAAPSEFQANMMNQPFQTLQQMVYDLQKQTAAQQNQITQLMAQSQSSGGGDSNAKAIAVTALIFVLFVIFGLIGFVVYQRRQAGGGSSHAISSADGNNMYSSRLLDS